ncbi:MAG: right-handed parallel beta-helix repeat-containing protein, partial [Planctomycetota bacterium]
GSCAFSVEARPARVRYSKEIVVRTPDWQRSPGSTTYYVDSGAGDDANRGTSTARPWKSLARVNGVVFAPGDRILFKAGSRYAGQLKPMGSGAEGRPIVVDSYGGDARPRIDGEGRTRATVHLYNVERWELRGLEITNTGRTRRARRRGVLVEIEDFGTAHDMVLRGLYIHDVNGSLVKKAGGGSAIKWRNGGKKKKSRFDGLLIEDCHLVRCERNGINASGYWTRDKWYPSLNVVIRGNLLEEIPGDGIVPIACDGALVERNVMRDCPRLLPHGDAAAGIWPWSSDNTVIQFNEVSDHKAPWDAQGFDSDWNCRNTVIQYNYSHDNEGGFLLVCNNGKSKMPQNIGNIGTVVRYNVSVNDGLRATGKHAGFSPTFHISGPCRDTRIYNNVIYVTRKPDAKIDLTIVKMDNWGGPWPVDTRFANNIFFAEGRADWEMRKARTTVFERNCFFGEHVRRPADEGAVLADPLFAGPVTAARGLDSLKGFMLRAGSPCIGAGKKVDDNGGRDFWGAKLPAGPPSIGAHEPSGRR